MVRICLCVHVKLSNGINDACVAPLMIVGVWPMAVMLMRYILYIYRHFVYSTKVWPLTVYGFLLCSFLC